MKRLAYILLLFTFLTTCKKNNKTDTSGLSNTPPAADTSIMHTGLVASTEQELQGVQSIDVLDTALVPFIQGALGLPPSAFDSVPPPGNQGSYNSCVGWVVGYGMLSYQFKNIEGHTDYNGSDKLFSPNYIWNQIISNGNAEQGISFGAALDLVEKEGCCKLTDMAVNVSPSTQPSAIANADAANYKLSDYYRFLTKDITKMKTYLSKGYPIMVGIEVDDDFRNLQKSPFERQSDGRLVWKKYTSNGRYGHALLICGYDDAINAFKALNSWGSSFGNGGYIWIDYDFFNTAVVSKLGLLPDIYVGVIKRPVLSITLLGAISQNSVQSGGIISSDWGIPVTSRGVCWGTSHDPNITGNKTNDGTGISSFISNISGLTANTTYYLKAYATNSTGTSYGTEVSFTTKTNPVVSFPTVTTTAISSVTETTAQSGGNISSDGGVPVTARGVCWSTSTNPTIANNKTTDGTGTGTFTSSLTGLTANTNYHVRAYAINSAGTAYGNDISFSTNASGVIFNPNLTYGTLTDIDGNVYKTIKIGTQTWMAENLKVIHYRNGDPIPNVTDSSQWINSTTGAWCYYDNDNQYNIPYGKLYNWLAVADSRNIAPSGWHVPLSSEWTILSTYLGGYTVAGGATKSVGLWNSPNVGATNSSGFSGIPGGWLGTESHHFSGFGYLETWWHYSVLSSINFSPLFTYLSQSSAEFQFYGLNPVFPFGINSAGISIRCVKD
jgi:uncharacterized protein (TIGR02145 family)